MPKVFAGMKKFFNDENKRQSFWIFIGLLFVMSFPLLNRQLYKGDDLFFHLLRTVGIKEGILSGQFPVRVDPAFLGGYGYGSSLFYPDIFLYIPAFFQILGLTPEISYRAFLVIIMALCFFIAYTCGRGISKSHYAAIIIAVVYSLSQYNLLNLYTRAALGEVQAYIFLPLILYGLYDLVFENYEKPWLLILGFIGIAFSHTITLEIAGLMAIGMSLVGIKRIIIAPRKIVKLVVSVLIVILCVSWFWIPLIEQTASGSFKFQSLAPVSISNYALRIPVVFSNSFNMAGDSFSFGTATLLLCVLRIFIKRDYQTIHQRKKIDLYLIAGFVCLFLVSKAFPWKYAPGFLNFILFPWRFYILASLFLSFAIGMIVDCLVPLPWKNLGLAILVLFMFGFAIEINTAALSDPVTFNAQDASFSIGYQEWLPSRVNKYLIPKSESLVRADDGAYLSYTKNSLRIQVVYSPGHQFIDVPLIYYKGYSAVFEDRQGKKIELELDGDGFNGTVRVHSGGINSPGVITVDYTGTVAQKIAFLVSLFSLAGCGLYFIFRNRRGIPGNYKKRRSSRRFRI